MRLMLCSHLPFILTCFVILIAADGLRDVFRGMTGALSSGFNCASVRALGTIQALTESQAKGELETKL